METNDELIERWGKEHNYEIGLETEEKRLPKSWREIKEYMDMARADERKRCGSK